MKIFLNPQITFQMDRLKGIFVWVLMILGIIVLGILAWGGIKNIMSKKNNTQSLEEQVQRAQLNYYSLGSAKAVTEMTSDLPPTNSTAQFQPIG